LTYNPEISILPTLIKYDKIELNISPDVKEMAEPTDEDLYLLIEVVGSECHFLRKV
jgi:hypothetical protein